MAKAQARMELEDETVVPDVAPVEESALATITPEQMQQARGVADATKAQHEEIMQTFTNWLVEKAETGDEELFETMASIMKEMLSADSAAELMRETTVLHARDILSEPLILHGFDIREGDYEESMFGYYAALTVSRPGSDRTRIVTCGANKVLMKLYALERLGEFPIAFYFKAKAGKKGNVLDIVSD